MNHEVPQTEGTALKERADFLAGYDAGMADAKRMQQHAERDYRENIRVDQEPVSKPYGFLRRKITFECGWEKRVPIFAIGFASPSELVCILWPIKFCIALRY
jgi:hypothetical protein